ncbi:MAG: hypothetical protein FJY66_03330 [Calditrichaeota bacterium]|nr:hypothetical protein [Calditrichota bacterium]
MRKDILRLTFLGLLVIAVTGCEVSDPGSPFPNQPPKTYLVLAPRDSSVFNHFAHLKWSGTDPDGEISHFFVVVDGETLKFARADGGSDNFTRAYEGTIPFYAPGDTAVPHLVKVIAVDDEGLADPSPPSRFFYASNTRPSVSFAATSVPNGATVGRGFAIELDGEDPNPSSLLYSIAIDDSIGGWGAWSEYSTFLFCDPSLSFLPTKVTLMNGNALTTGEHRIYARIKDAGEAQGLQMISVRITVADDLHPAMNATITGAYGSDTFYPDGSVFYRSNIETKLIFSATATAYNGMINAFSYAIGDSPFVFLAWQEASEIVLTDAPAGEYLFHIRARDVAGEISGTISHRIYILELEPTDSILIVDETRDGTGGAGSPNDEQVDNFYAAVMGTRPFAQVDYATHQIGGVSYLSPLDLYRFRLVIYHTDDKANFNIASNRAVLAEYMDRGGKVIFGGWDLLAPFGVAYQDSAVYSATAAADLRFVYTYMRLFYAVRSSATSPREFKGMTGVGGYPDVAIDPAKVPASWAGALDKCWAFNNRGETITIGTFDAATEGSSFEGKHCAHVYIGPIYSVAMLGFPLYFAYENQAVAFMGQLLTEMLGP